MERKHLHGGGKSLWFFRNFSFLIYLFIFPLDIIYRIYIYRYNTKSCTKPRKSVQCP